VAWVAGFDHVAARLHSVEPIWFLVALGAEAVAYVGYVLSYREVARVDRGTKMSARTAVAAVTAGFGAFVARGGFAVDLHAFQPTGVTDREARVRVLGLGALEYALLGPAACVTAIVLLANGKHTPNLGLTLPWAIAVPVGFIAAFWAVGHRQRFADKGGWREGVSQALDSIHVLKCLFKTKHLIGPLGTAVYWFGDIVCPVGLKAFTHGTPDIELLLLGYATGYALTRRTLPLAGAGAVERCCRSRSLVRHLARGRRARGVRVSRLQPMAAAPARSNWHALAARRGRRLLSNRDGNLSAAERRRRRAVDQHVYELACPRRRRS
jgi:hypothetical protein